jgi:hypothetical protein
LDQNSTFFAHYGKSWKYIKDLSDRFAIINVVFATLGLSIMFLGIIDFGWSLYQLQWKATLASCVLFSFLYGIASVHFDLNTIDTLLQGIPLGTLMVYIYCIYRLKQLRNIPSTNHHSRDQTLQIVMRRLVALTAFYFVSIIPNSVLVLLGPDSFSIGFSYCTIVLFSATGFGHFIIITFVLGRRISDSTSVQAHLATETNSLTKFISRYFGEFSLSYWISSDFSSIDPEGAYLLSNSGHAFYLEH